MLSLYRPDSPVAQDWGRMSSLAWLMLQDNDLTGTIPAALSDLPNLSLL